VERVSFAKLLPSRAEHRLIGLYRARLRTTGRTSALDLISVELMHSIVVERRGSTHMDRTRRATNAEGTLLLQGQSEGICGDLSKDRGLSPLVTCVPDPGHEAAAVTKRASTRVPEAWRDSGGSVVSCNGRSPCGLFWSGSSIDACMVVELLQEKRFRTDPGVTSRVACERAGEPLERSIARPRKFARSRAGYGTTMGVRT
jgi:hypothetical protein